MRVSHSLLYFVFLLFALQTKAQLGYDLTIKKPEPYDNRKLKAEKTGDSKLKATKRFLQNTTTHFNYYFNANERLNEILAQAKEAFREDYSKLLPFYNYSLDETAANKSLLDSVIFKSETGIVLHDLRNDWIDNMYMLWGKAYYFQKEFDSAHQMFQFINWAFAEKEKDGYYRFIGSRMDGNNATNISTKEKNSILKKVFSEPPSRNDAFIWMVRTMIQKNQMAEAGSLISTLRKDPSFPRRLNGTLDEVSALWYYNQEIWDSSAVHLVKALDEAPTKNERARWEFLAAQLYERSKKWQEAEQYYSKALSHTTDPVLEVYARLNLIKVHKDDTEKFIDNNVAALVKMAKRDKYEEYRDIIYSMAAQMEIERGNLEAAQEYLLKGSKSHNTTASSNEAFLQLADLFYGQHKYTQAANFYDSVRIENLAKDDEDRIQLRRKSLAEFRIQKSIYDRQDSLQRIASMPEAERLAFVKKLVKQLRKEQGLKDENAPITGGSGFSSKTADLFGAQPTKGEWYFYNDALKLQGAAEFKSVWGNRPNSDNWRRFADLTAQIKNTTVAGSGNIANNADAAANEISTSSLLSKLPLTSEKLQVSNDSLKNAMAGLGSVYVNSIEDYPAAINMYEQLRTRFPEYTPMDKVLFDLYYSYTKVGDLAKANQIKKMLGDKYASGRYNNIIATGLDPQTKGPTTEATKTYEGIYDLFLEGKFEEALAEKRNADSIYKTNYWSPQLLYIEAVYYIKQRNDSSAKNVLNKLVQQGSNPGITSKAANLLNVLNRRKQIEEELSNLQVDRRPEDTAAHVITQPIVQQPEKRIDSSTRKVEIATSKPPTLPVVKDTLVHKPLAKPVFIFSYAPEKPHLAVILLNKVDIVFGNEAKNAFFRYNRTAYSSQNFNLNVFDLNLDTKLLLIGDFPNAQAAIDYIEKAKPIAAREIVPWLKPDKYSFEVISVDNLDVLKNNPDLTKYKQFLDQYFPGKF